MFIRKTVNESICARLLMQIIGPFLEVDQQNF